MDDDLTKEEYEFIDLIAWELCNDHTEGYIEKIIKCLNLNPFELKYQLTIQLEKRYKK